MNNTFVKIIIRSMAVIAVLFLFLPSWVFTVNEQQLAVVLRFGNPVREYTEPGVRFKVPFVETVRMLPKTQQFWGGERSDELPDLPTRDDKKIELIPWAVWRIKEPTDFVKRLRTTENAEQRVAQITRSAIRDVLTKYDLAEIVRSTNRPIPASSDLAASSAIVSVLANDPALASDPALLDSALAPTTKAGNAATAGIQMGRTKILEIIKQEATRRLARPSDDDGEGGRGIELVDLGISQVDFVESVRAKTFDRWIAERDSISARNTNEGERLKQKIVNEAKAEVAKIEGEGQQVASQTKGTADALAIRKYAEVINEVGDFYTFTRTLEAYEKALNKDSRMILTTDSDFFQMLKKLEPAAPLAPTADTANPGESL